MKTIIERFDELDKLKVERDEAWARVFAGREDSKRASKLSDKADDMMVQIMRRAP